MTTQSKLKNIEWGLDYMTEKGYRSIVFKRWGEREVFARYHKCCREWSRTA